MAGEEQSSHMASTSTSQPKPESIHSLDRVYSGNHLDDSSSYKHHLGSPDARPINEEISNSSSEDQNITEKEYEDEIDRRRSTDVSPEVQDGIEMERDLETGPQMLEKIKSTRSKKSVRDPNLVGWEGMNDGMNPKNWSSGRKWAAIFVGE